MSNPGRVAEFMMPYLIEIARDHEAGMWEVVHLRVNGRTLVGRFERWGEAQAVADAWERQVIMGN